VHHLTSGAVPVADDRHRTFTGEELS
jgi:hypothetical protein